MEQSIMKTTQATLRTLISLSAVAALVAGCLADSTSPDENASNGDNTDGTVDNTIGKSNAHLLPLMRGSSNALSSNAAPAGAHLSYYGGPVVSNVKVFTIFWG